MFLRYRYTATVEGFAGNERTVTGEVAMPKGMFPFVLDTALRQVFSDVNRENDEVGSEVCDGPFTVKSFLVEVAAGQPH